MDDDVEYLGTRLATLDDVQLLANGIVLHVEKCGDKPAHDLTFHRQRSACVSIGRKSASDDRSMRRENDDHNAVFACQVVSARHAKLVLSSTGRVYIVDLHSRHGTHLLRHGETAPKMLQPDVETVLADGDVLTFGKVVGAGSYHVSPVTVRVELLTGSPSSEPSADRAPTPSQPSSPVLEARPRKPSSGRYGLITLTIESDSPRSCSSLSVSSNAASSPSDQESDVEDEPECIPAVQGKPSVKIPTFRNLIREVCQHSPVVSDVPDEPIVMEDTPSPDDIIHSPLPEPLPTTRSPSPINLVLSMPSEVPQSEPAIIGAWPASRPDSPRHSSPEVEAGQSEVPLVPEPDREPVPLPVPPPPTQRTTPLYPTTELHHLVQCLNANTPANMFSGSGPFSNSIFGLPSVPLPQLPPPPPLHRIPSLRLVAERVSAEVKGSLKSVEERVAALQDTITDLKSRQTMTEEDVVDLQSHVELLEPDSERLLCRITGAERNIATLSTLQGQMTALQNQVNTLRARVDASEFRPVEPLPMDDVRACATALNSLVSEMKVLREDVEQRIEARIDAIQSTREDALDALKGVIAEAETVRSAKRKRDDEEAEEVTPEVVAAVAPVACSPPAIPSPEVVTVPQTPVPQVPISIPDVIVPVAAPEVLTVESARPRKRARTAIYKVAHTAAAMVIGAAATWSALAFS